MNIQRTFQQKLYFRFISVYSENIQSNFPIRTVPIIYSDHVILIHFIDTYFYTLLKYILIFLSMLIKSVLHLCEPEECNGKICTRVCHCDVSHFVYNEPQLI